VPGALCAKALMPAVRNTSRQIINIGLVQDFI
jgi:hypothetical protein